MPSAQGVAPYQQQLRAQGVESAAAVQPVKGALNIHGIVQPEDKLITNKIKTKDNREKTVSCAVSKTKTDLERLDFLC